MVITREQVRRPTLAKETVDVPSLGGEVVIRGMTLSERLTLGIDGNQLSAIARVLAACVLDADSQPVLTVDEWEAFGDLNAAIDLYARISQLSLLTRESIEKKTESIPS